MTYLSVTEAARRAGCSRRYILAEIQRQVQGKAVGLVAERVGNQWNIPEDEFRQWMARERRGTRGKGK